MISYSLNLPKGSLAFFDLRVNHHHIEFAISEICTSVVPLFSFSLSFYFLVWVYLSYVFSYILNSLKAGHVKPAIEPRMADLLFADLIRVFHSTYPTSSNPQSPKFLTRTVL